MEEFAYYSDEACNQRATVVSSDLPCQEEEVLALQLTDTCPGLELLHVAGPVEGELYTLDDATGECRTITDGERATLRAVGEPVDPDTFERATTP